MGVRVTCGVLSGPQEATRTQGSTKDDSGIPLLLGPGTRMSDPYVCVVFWGTLVI